MYCLTLDMIETGLFYNKTLFDQYGLHEPKDWNELLEVEKALASHGKIPLGMAMWCLSDWATDLVFDQLYYPITPLIDLQCDPRRAEYLANYLDRDEIVYLHRKGFFTAKDPRWVDSFRILREWRPYMQRDLTNDDPLKLFMSQNAAMLWYTSEMVQKLVRDPDRKFDYGIFYLPKLTKTQSPFASGRQMCVIGGSAMQYCVSNSAIRDTGNAETSERLKRVIAFLQFLTIPANTERVVNEPICYLPNIKGADPHKELLQFDEFLKRPYSSSKWFYTFDLKFDDVFLRMLELYLNGGMTEDEYLDVMDRNLTDAGENITRRKNLDFTAFDKIWSDRKHLRETLPGLPEGAQ
jgi:raffinose/stachyose/melibiose transport system substrate-binding protein